MAVTASDFKMPGGIETFEDYKKAQAAPKYYESSADVNDEMGQQEFLLLFTTQLQNQNPLDPMKNEEFVAQLAQFSQLEATTTMAADLRGLTGSLQKERMMHYCLGFPLTSHQKFCNFDQTHFEGEFVGCLV